MQNKSKKMIVRSVSALVALFFIAGAVSVIRLVLSDDTIKRKRNVQMVTLLKPPPPQKIKEKPPEPEIEKKEEIVEPLEEPEPEPMDDLSDEVEAMDDLLGLDAEGTGGGDDFGLRAKQGGRSLLAGYGDRALMQRYAWYTRMIQDEIRKRINDYMASNGGVPQGDHKAMVQIELDQLGRIVHFKLHETSGNKNVDMALKETLLAVQIQETPPEGMPRTIKLKISSRG